MQVNLPLNRKNILYVFGGEKAQGAEIVIERLMCYNRKNVGSTHIILSPGTFADSLIASGRPYTVVQLGRLKKLNRSSTGKLNYLATAIRNYFSVSFMVWRYINRNNIHIVHANTIVPASYLLPLILCSRLLLPRVKWYWSNHDLKYFSRVEELLSNLCARFYHVTLVVSEAVKKKYLRHQDKVNVLYNGLDVSVFKPDTVQRNGFRNANKLQKDDLVIGIAANINPDKGQLELISVFNELSAAFPNASLILAGGYAAQFPQYAQDVKTAISGNKRIRHAGFIEQMTSFYNGCDIIVNNSNNYRSESLGTTIYEAMACEKIVVASNTGGTPEIITDKADGLLFEAENLADLKQKLSFALYEFADLNLMRKNARKKVIARFNITDMMVAYNHIIGSTP